MIGPNDESRELRELETMMATRRRHGTASGLVDPAPSIRSRRCPARDQRLCRRLSRSWSTPAAIATPTE
jgi:hypothetical protein